MNALMTCLRRASIALTKAPAPWVAVVSAQSPLAGLDLAAEPGVLAAAQAGMPADAVLGEPLPGCGWFDSSFELQQGLAVSEFDDGDLPVAALWFPALDGGRGVPVASAWLH